MAPKKMRVKDGVATRITEKAGLQLHVGRGVTTRTKRVGALVGCQEGALATGTK